MELDLERDTKMKRDCSTEEIPPDAVRTNARQQLSPAVVQMAAARRALAERPFHSKRAVRKPRNRSYSACVIPPREAPNYCDCTPWSTVIKPLHNADKPTDASDNVAWFVEIESHLKK